jgi:hypothetical protein
VQMTKSDPEAQTKSSLSDCTWLERWVWVLFLIPLEIPNAFRKSGSLYIYTHFFFSLFLSSLSSFFLFLSFLSLFFLSFFFLLPYTLDYISTYLLGSSPMLRRLHVLGQRGDEVFVPR